MNTTLILRSNPRLTRWVVFITIFIALTGIVGCSPQQSKEKPTETLPVEISPKKAATLRDGGAFVLDVRTPEEWNEQHIPGAVHIPLDQLESRVDEIPSDQEIVVYCRSGNRSQAGRDILLSAGFETVTSMQGGITEWKAEGYPVAEGP